MSKAHLCPVEKHHWIKEKQKNQVRSTFKRQTKDSATVSVQMILMHFSGNCWYGDDYVPQEQGTNIMYVLGIS